MAVTRRTPLYELQAAAGGRFVEFAGWEMPVQFAGVVAEHRAVRSAAGLFDVSHMGELVVEGPEAAAGLDAAVTNHVGKLADGKALYTVMCAESGGIIDDLIIYREGAERFFVVVNAARIDADVAHLREVLGAFDCALTDVSDATALLALQGPRALEILAAAGGPTPNAPFTFVDATVGGVGGVRVARTGYTGEDGVELYVAAANASALWRAVVAAGEPFGLQLCGLGARDTLRMEMKFPLYGVDIDLAHNPIEAGLAWTVKLGKGPFVGSEALAAEKARGPRRALVGFRMRDRGIPRHGYVIRVDGEDAGVVTSGTHSPSLDEPIGIGWVPVTHKPVGSEIEIVIRGRAVPAVVVETPFYRNRES